MRRLFLAVTLSLAAGAAWAQTPAGGVFQANTYTTRSQYRSSVAIHPGGAFTVVWDSMEQDGSWLGVYGQRYDNTGARVGSEFRVNTYTTDFEWDCHVAAQGAGFVVVFESDAPPGGIRARLYDGAGQPLAPEFRVQESAATGVHPDVAATPGGGFIVAWEAEGDGDQRGIFARRFNGLGTPLGSEFQVNSFTGNDQSAPALGVDASGRFTVFWSSDDTPGDPLSGVRGQRYDRGGVRLGGEFRVNTYTTGVQYGAHAAGAGNDMVVVWDSTVQDGSSWGVYGQRYDENFAPLGPEFQINTYTPGRQAVSTVTADENFNFVVNWESGDYAVDLRGRRYDAAGHPRGGEFPVGPPDFEQLYPGIAGDAFGNVVSTWTPYAGEVLGQRYGWLFPAAIQVDPVAVPGAADGNGVLEPCETAATIRTSWQNLNGAPQAFGGALSGLIGPAGGTYTIPDPLASFGTVPNGATASCQSAGDCYVVGVACAPTRPVPHWDTQLPEDITPLALGLSHRWILHVGDSFTDVPRSSSYYPFVETLLHHGITSGCSGTTYCPTAATTREQMAVFVLTAGAPGQQPPPCTTPLFRDVPASSPYCRWIEELARRGVVTGCGGFFDYCPGDAVTREQMAVFVLRTVDPSLSPPACTTPLFSDVPASSPYCRWIEELARRGVVSGCGGNFYCPTQPVTREQMGVFISGTFGLRLY